MSRFLIEQITMPQLWILVALIPIFSCSQSTDSETKTVAQLEVEEPQEIAEPSFTVDELLGQFDPKQHVAFKEIPASYSSRQGMYLREEALNAFVKMADSAKSQGIILKIISATRNFNRQKTIWEGKWNGTRKQSGRNLKEHFPDPTERALEILKYSSMPGTSRHHWGTDIDINNLNNSYFSSGRGKAEYEWLRDNGYEFGFCQVYSEKDEARPNGYEEEKWHWSYMPLGSIILQEYKDQIDSSTFGGFDGSDALPFEQVMQYVSGIAPECK